MVANMLPGRSRKDIKNKFKKEEKMNAGKIEFALSNSLPLGIDEMDRFYKNGNNQ